MKYFATMYAFTIAIPNAVINVTQKISRNGPATEMTSRTSRIAQILT